MIDEMRETLLQQIAEKIRSFTEQQMLTIDEVKALAQFADEFQYGKARFPMVHIVKQPPIVMHHRADYMYACTSWFEMRKTPKRVGVYQVKVKVKSSFHTRWKIQFSYFDGKNWANPEETVLIADRNKHIAAGDIFRWRGILK
jgi:hypothetical protein